VELTIGCAGSQYLPENEGFNCYLKSPAVTTGIFTSDSDEAKSSGAVLSLVGSCDYWTQNGEFVMQYPLLPH
jgi:hypothetical protein